MQLGDLAEERRIYEQLTGTTVICDRVDIRTLPLITKPLRAYEARREIPPPPSPLKAVDPYLSDDIRRKRPSKISHCDTILIRGEQKECHGGACLRFRSSKSTTMPNGMNDDEFAGRSQFDHFGMHRSRSSEALPR